jgi:hypothetical protein
MAVAGSRVLGSNGTENSLKDSGDCRAALNSRNCLQDDELLQLNR